ncbi:MAG: metalloregulator ArsR/SmtB family transcription factor [Actinomycetia bacterium]|nr:metalloregulator ArsR/SmtB family transcription factor [Actinomycetes bacterium]
MAGSTRSDTDVAAKLFRGFGDRTRLAILAELADGERRVTDLVETLGRSQSTISSHVACLRDCGLVEARVEGRQMFYRVAFPEVVALLRSAEELLTEIGHEVELCPNYTTSREL